MNLERIKEVLRYEPDTGLFYWKSNRGGTARAGTIAGSPHRKGYLTVSVLGKAWLAHRLAWAFIHGEEPPPGLQIDHKNGDRSDTRWENLRIGDASFNQQNRRRPAKHNKLGVLGVQRYGRRFAAFVRIGGRSRRVGTFSTPEAAHECYVQAKRELHPGSTL